MAVGSALSFTPDFQRRTFSRDEKALALNWQVSNPTGQRWAGTVTFLLGGRGLGKTRLRIPANGAQSVDVELDPALLQPGAYDIAVCLAEKGTGARQAIDLTRIAIGPWRNPERFATISWPRLKEAHLIPEMHAMGLNVMSFGSIADLDQLTELGAHGAVRIDPIPHMTHQAHFDRHGASYPCPISGEHLADCVAQTEALLEKYGNHPSIRMVNVSTEVWGMLCFCPSCTRIIRETFGLDPNALQDAIKGRGIRRFKGSLMIPWIEEHRATDSVVDSGNSLSRYARWYWTQGGVNLGNMVVAETLQKRRPDIWALTEPLMRFASLKRYREPIVIGDWAWPPDPREWIRVGTYVRSLARSWDRPFWLTVTSLKLPGTFAPYLMSSPCDLFLMENWLALSAFPEALQYTQIDTMLPQDKQRPGFPMAFKSVAECEKLVAGLDWKAACAKMKSDGLRRTAAWTPGLPGTLRDFSDRVLTPLGPLLRKTRARSGTIGVFLSFTTQVMGFEDWWSAFKWQPLADAILRGPYATDILFEDQVERIDLNAYPMIVLPAVKFMTDDTKARFQGYIDQGGLLLCDRTWQEHFNGAVLAEELGPQTRADAKEAFTSLDLEQLMMDTGRARSNDRGPGLAGIWGTITARLRPDYSTTCPDVVIREGLLPNTRIVVLVNTKLERGPLFGHYPKALEKSAAVAAEVSIPGGADNDAYDLMASCPVRLDQRDGTFRFNVELPPADGRILALYPQAIGELSVQAPAKASPGKRVRVNVRLTDEHSAPFAGVVPLTFTLAQPDGAESDVSHGDVIENGTWEFDWVMPVQTASDMPVLAGTWTVTVTELASGKSDTAAISVH